MSKAHKSLRIEDSLAAQVKLISEAQGTSENAAYEYVIRAGLIALNGKKTEPVKEKDPRSEKEQQITREMFDLLTEHNKRLEDQVLFLQDQARVKDEQIRELISSNSALVTVTQQAQTLHAITETKALEAPAGGADQPRRWFMSFFKRG